MRKAEVDWVRGLLAELDSGTFPGMDFWRALHESGALDGSGKIPELPEGIEIPSAFSDISAREEAPDS
jgi:hypothetical protein